MSPVKARKVYFGRGWPELGLTPNLDSPDFPTLTATLLRWPAALWSQL